MESQPRPLPQQDPRPLPSGWPVGSFQTYVEAQAAVDMLSDTGDFPVSELTIVGVNLMEVERVIGRLSWGRVLAGGAASGAWMGVFFGLLIGLFSENWISPLLVGIVMGLVFGTVSSAVSYASTQGRRDFSSKTQIVAGRYDVLCDPHHARAARDIIARANLGGKVSGGA
ncbi:magnesium transporter [Corynebacterium hindlerae]|uniref:Magnesium transporter n=1 Tax=Corynebacterium hindlerae TaxID=699041 RepID=A0A7G5FGA3_9CORY|nr:general stress protein [Corynebacterium hindlerae]QMV85644.1 magnesium transporter [Corynebacterium hindlerae]